MKFIRYSFNSFKGLGEPRSLVLHHRAAQMFDFQRVTVWIQLLVENFSIFCFKIINEVRLKVFNVG